MFSLSTQAALSGGKNYGLENVGYFPSTGLENIRNFPSDRMPKLSPTWNTNPTRIYSHWALPTGARRSDRKWSPKWPPGASDRKGPPKWPLEPSDRKWPPQWPPRVSDRPSDRKWPPEASDRKWPPKWPQVTAGSKWPQVTASDRFSKNQFLLHLHALWEFRHFCHFQHLHTAFFGFPFGGRSVSALSDVYLLSDVQAGVTK